MVIHFWVLHLVQKVGVCESSSCESWDKEKKKERDFNAQTAVEPTAYLYLHCCIETLESSDTWLNVLFACIIKNYFIPHFIDRDRRKGILGEANLPQY